MQSFAVEGVNVRNGTLLWYENTSQLRYTVDKLDLSAGAIGSAAPVPLSVSLQFRDEVAKLAADLKMSATAAIDDKGSVSAKKLDLTVAARPAGNAKPRDVAAKADSLVFDRNAQTLAVTNLTTETAGLRAQWTVSGKTLVDNPSVEGSVSVSNAPIATLLERSLSRRRRACKRRSSATSRCNRSSRSAATRSRSTSRASTAEALGMKVSGEASLKGDEATGSVTTPEFEPSSRRCALLRANAPANVDLSALGKVALATRFDANVSTGRASLTNLKVSALGATLSGNVDVVPGQKGATYRGALSTSRFAPDAAAKAFAKMLPATLDAKKLGNLRVDAKFVFDGAADTVALSPFEAEMFGLSVNGEANGRAVRKPAPGPATRRRTVLAAGPDRAASACRRR